MDCHAVRAAAAALLLLLGVFVGSGLSIVCYQCNSAYDPRCGDPFDAYSLGHVDCNMKQIPEHLRPLNVTAAICRKNVQKVYGKFRVVRGCGYLVDSGVKEGRSCVQRSGTHDVHVQYCACEGDYCNGAARPPAHAAAIAGAVLLSLLLAASLHGAFAAAIL